MTLNASHSNPYANNFLYVFIIFVFIVWTQSKWKLSTEIFSDHSDALQKSFYAKHSEEELNERLKSTDSPLVFL